MHAIGQEGIPLDLDLILLLNFGSLFSKQEQ